jgi:IclR family KDG regulon transcriptional repressor
MRTDVSLCGTETGRCLTSCPRPPRIAGYAPRSETEGNGSRMAKTVLKGFAVLETLAQSESPRSVTELARDLRFTKSNVHRLLRTLVTSGYVRYIPEVRRYETSLKLWELGTLLVSRLDLKVVAAPRLQELAARTHETVHLSIFDGTDAVYIDKIEGVHPVRAYSRVGGRAPAYCVATGKVLLAHQLPEVIAKVAAHLERHTPHTTTKPEVLYDELRRIRRDGYAINRGQWREGVGGAAAPIRDGSGAVVAAVGISGPTDRLRLKVLRSFVPFVIATAQKISRGLGYSPLPRVARDGLEVGARRRANVTMRPAPRSATRAPAN